MGTPKSPRDTNQLGKFIVDVATGVRPPELHEVEDQRDPAAVERGRLGGLRGGQARAKALSRAERAEIARKAAQARWKK